MKVDKHSKVKEDVRNFVNRILLDKMYEVEDLIGSELASGKIAGYDMNWAAEDFNDGNYYSIVEMATDSLMNQLFENEH